MASDKKTVTLEFKALTSEFDSKIKSVSSTITNLNGQLKLNATQLANDSANVDLLKDRVTLLNAKLDSQQEVTEALKNKLEAAKKVYGENSKEVENLSNKVLYATIAEEKIKNEISGVNSKIETQKNKMTESETATSRLKEKIEEQAKALRELKSKYTEVVLEEGKNSSSAKNLQSEMLTLNKELANNVTELNEAESASDKFTDSLENLDGEVNNTHGSFTVFKGVLADLGSNLIQSGISSIKNFSTEIVNLGSNFTSSLSKVQAISGATMEDLQAIEDKARELGAATKYSATEVSDGFQYMAMAGWKTNDMLNGIEGVLNLAAASGEDLATTSDIVTDALTAFGMSASESGHFSDILASASSNANTNVSMMGETFKYAASIAGSLGYTAEDTALAIGLMANSGIKASQAGTSLRSIMSRIATNTGGARDALNGLGIETVNSDGSMRAFGEVINDLRTKFSGLSSEEQTNFAKTIAGQEALSGFLAIANSGDEDFLKLQTAINNCDGAAENMANTMQDNLEGDLTSMGSKVEELGFSIYDKLELPMRGAVQFVNNSVIPTLKWGIDNFPLIAVLIGGVTAAIMANKMANQGLTAAQLLQSGVTKGLTGAQTALNTVLKMNPIGLVILAITGLIAIFMVLWNKCEWFRNFWKNLWEAIPRMVFDGFNGVKNFFLGTIQFFKEKIEWIKNLFFSFGQSVGDVVGGAFKGAINGALSFAENILNTPIRAINTLIDVINAVPGISIGRLDEFHLPRLKGGMSRVPSDYYPVYLDEGERVLTKEENKAYNRIGGLTGLLNNQLSSIATTQAEPQSYERFYDYLERIANKNMTLNVDSKELAAATAEASDQISGETLSLKERGLEI